MLVYQRVHTIKPYRSIWEVLQIGNPPNKSSNRCHFFTGKPMSLGYMYRNFECICFFSIWYDMNPYEPLPTWCMGIISIFVVATTTTTQIVVYHDDSYDIIWIVMVIGLLFWSLQDPANALIESLVGTSSCCSHFLQPCFKVKADVGNRCV